MLSDSIGNKLNIYVPDYVVFDLETTGINCHTDQVVEISALKVIGGNVVDEFSTLVNPGMHIPSGASYMNGITDNMVKNCPCFQDVLRDFLAFAEDSVLVGHNIHTFDMKFICRDAETYFGKMVGNDYIDTFILAKNVIKGLGSYSLSNLADRFGIDTAGAHRALVDCHMNQQLFECLGKEMEKQISDGSILQRCDKCGGLMVRRNGKYGEFWGCTNYPTCKNTRDV